MQTIEDLLRITKDKPHIWRNIQINLSGRPPCPDGIYVKRNGQWIKLED